MAAWETCTRSCDECLTNTNGAHNMRPVCYSKGDSTLDKELLKRARARISSVPILLNVISQRVKQLQAGHRPLVKPTKGQEREDIALQEVAEGLMTLEIDLSSAVSEDKEEKDNK